MNLKDIPFENQFIYDKKYSVETKAGAIEKTVFCIKKATTNQYYTETPKGVNLFYKETENTNNELNIITDNLFEILDAENEVLYYTDKNGYRYIRKTVN